MSVLGFCALCAVESAAIVLVDVRSDEIIYEGTAAEAKDSEFRNWIVESVDILDGRFLIMIR